MGGEIWLPVWNRPLNWNEFNEMLCRDSFTASHSRKTRSFENYIALIPSYASAWWRHQMETSSALLAICAGNSPVGPGEFPAQRPVTRSFDAFFDLSLNKRFSKQSTGLTKFQDQELCSISKRHGFNTHSFGLETRRYLNKQVSMAPIYSRNVFHATSHTLGTSEVFWALSTSYQRVRNTSSKSRLRFSGNVL